jgi:hypothetical protein
VVRDRRDGKVYNIALFTNRGVKAGEVLIFSYSEPSPKSLDCKKGGGMCGVTGVGVVLSPRYSWDITRLRFSTSKLFIKISLARTSLLEVRY